MMSAWRGTTAVMTIPTLDTTLLSNANLLFWFLGLVFRVENSGLCGLEDACSVGRDVGARLRRRGQLQCQTPMCDISEHKM